MDIQGMMTTYKGGKVSLAIKLRLPKFSTLMSVMRQWAVELLKEQKQVKEMTIILRLFANVPYNSRMSKCL